MRAMIYVQHLLGSGPAVRAAALAAALSEEGVETALVTGNRLPPFARDGAYEIFELPFARARNASVSSVVDDRGTQIDERWLARRAARLQQIHEDFRPDILITETWPFGSRFFDRELDGLLAAAREAEAAPAIVCLLRDVVAREGDAAAERGVAERLRRDYDLVLVNGDPDYLPLEASFGAVDEIADLVRYTGYLHAVEEAPEPPAGEGRDEVIVSCGGGAVGDLLLMRAVQARELSAARDLVWRVLVGHDMDDMLLSRLASEADTGVVVERARPDFPNLVRRARLSISQGGYNTLADVLAAGCPAVFVPFARAGGTEQTQRVTPLAERGGAVVVPELDLTPERLAGAVDAALALPAGPRGVDLGGAGESVRRILDLAAARAPAATV